MENEVRSVMTTKVVVAHPDTPFLELVGLLGRGISAVPVVDAEDRVVGVVSEADLLLHEAHPSSKRRQYWLSLLEPPSTQTSRRLVQDLQRGSGRVAAELMTQPAITIGEHETLQRAAQVMHARDVKRLPVVDEGGRLIGIVSRSDLLSPFLRSDGSIRHDVQRALGGAEPKLPDVQVDVREGVVTLAGHLALGADYGHLLEVVEAVPGVVEVHAGWGARHVHAAS